jgi:hypothetical protein
MELIHQKAGTSMPMGFFVGGIIGTTITFFVLSNWAVVQNLFG